MIGRWGEMALKPIVQTKTASKTNSMTVGSDEQLVAAARDGDFGAFEVLFERHRVLVYRFTFQMVHSRDDAEDLVQEVFVRAFKNLGRYRDEAKFTTWLLRIATNLATDRARMYNRRNRIEQKEQNDSLTWMTVGTFEDPMENMEQDRLRQILAKAIKELPKQHRSAIVMRDIEEMEYQDIADVFNCSLGGAKLRVLRARRALKEKVEPLLNSEEAGI